jgi:hypothetical protein
MDVFKHVQMDTRHINNTWHVNNVPQIVKLVMDCIGIIVLNAQILHSSLKMDYVSKHVILDILIMDTVLEIMNVTIKDVERVVQQDFVINVYLITKDNQPAHGNNYFHLYLWHTLLFPLFSMHWFQLVYFWLWKELLQWHIKLFSHFHYLNLQFGFL